MRKGLLLLLLLPLVASDPCNKAKKIWEGALKKPPSQRIEPLLKAKNLCPSSFSVRYTLGLTYAQLGEKHPQKQAKYYQKALHYLRTSLPLSPDRPTKAKVLAQIAALYQALGQKYKALLTYHRSLRLKKDPKIQQIALRLDQELSSKPDMKKAFRSYLALRAIEIIGPEDPGVPVRIHFPFDSAEITPKAEEEIKTLAKALKEVKGYKHIVLIGHTDLIGSDQYNLKLSLMRAMAVKKYLVEKYGFSPQMLSVDGKGKTQPLYFGTSPEINALNRRVEIKIIK